MQRRLSSRLTSASISLAPLLTRPAVQALISLMKWLGLFTWELSTKLDRLMVLVRSPTHRSNELSKEDQAIAPNTDTLTPGAR